MASKANESQTNKALIVSGMEDSDDDQITIFNADLGIAQFQITLDQLRSLRRKYEQNADGAESFEELLTRTCPGGIGTDQYILVRWCGMWLGIEPDGYTHS